MARRLANVALLAAVAALWACPRGLDVAPAQGEACDADADCNRLSDGAVQQCGRLSLCVRGACEVDAATRIAVCRP